MKNDKFAELDRLAAPDGYVAAIQEEDERYLSVFRGVCRRYNIEFAQASEDERDFVIKMAEKDFYQKQA